MQLSKRRADGVCVAGRQLFIFDVLSAFECPLFVELHELSCVQVTRLHLASSAVLYRLPVLMQVFPLFVAFCTVSLYCIYVMHQLSHQLVIKTSTNVHDL